VQLDVILPTYNRAHLLPRAIAAFLAARVPAGVEARLLVVDNNSSDPTRDVVAAEVARQAGRVGYLFEGRQGRHHALNAGIAASEAAIIGFVDDDETMDAAWIEVVARELGGSGLDFIGGPYLPNWLAPAPAWLPAGFPGPVGIFDYGQKRFDYGTVSCPTHLLGGNAAVRRAVFQRVGPYSDRYPYAEDLEMYRRIVATGFKGTYVPELVIRHDIPARRLTKGYFRHWVHDAARNDGRFVRDGVVPPEGATLLGAPRWLWRRAAEGLALRLWRAGWPDDPAAFAGELHAVDLVGFLRGRWLGGGGSARLRA
jgi:glycosyltransferase involved in cell wall biosynthesis